MRLPILKAALLAVLGAGVASAHAADELVINAFENGEPAAGLEVILDGDVSEVLNERGAATFDLRGGPHTITLELAGVQVHQFSFSAANGQLVDITVRLEIGEDPQEFIEAYFPTETARDRASAPKGTFAGVVSNNGTPLSGATVLFPKANQAVTTGPDGRFQAEVPRGVYALTISHPELDGEQTEQVRVVSGVGRSASFRYGGLGDLAGAPEEVVVLGTFDPTAFGESEQFSVNIIETLGIEELARFGDTDVAASVVRVPSVTVQSGRFVFIRGLGGRYVTTTLNGATLPSTDPTKREVPLDLFPSNIVKQLDIKKSFLASMPGESTGGNLVINTRTFPEEAAGKLSASLGYVSDLTGDTVQFDAVSGDYDFFGLDDGSRDIPGGVEAITALLDCDPCVDALDDDQERGVRQLGTLLLRNGLDLGSATAAPNLSLGLSYGDLFDLGGREFGYFVAGNFKNGWSQRGEGISRTYEPLQNGELQLLNDLTFEEASNTVDASALIALGLNVGDSSYQSTTLLSRSSESATRVSQGRDGDSGAQTFQYSIDWEERQFLSQQFSGEHLLGPGGGLTATWQVSGSHARRYAPDRRTARFDLEGGDGIFDLRISEVTRRYDDLSDANFDASADFDYLFDNRWGDATAEWGAQLIQRERDSESVAFGFQAPGGQETNTPNLLVSEVINAGTITGDAGTGIAFFNRTLPSDSYQAELDLLGAYGAYSQRFANAYQLIVGLRYEDYEQITDTVEVGGAQRPVRALVDDAVFMPTLSLNWEISDRQQLRFAASRTVARPDFKETSFATFFDSLLDIRVQGNPNLVVSDITNLDLRWEMYWSDTENVSVALFSKVIDNPIKRVLQRASGTVANYRTFENGNEADVIGLELDGRRDFDLNAAGSRNVFVTLNASVIDSEIDVDEGGGTRKLQGQPDYTFNLAVGYDDFSSRVRQEATLLLNQSGETIIDVGLSGLPNVIEEPRLALDLNYKAFLTDSLVLRAKVGNLLDETVELTQGGRVFQEYKQGVTLQAGIDWSF